jgi:hypothetical protein
MEEGISAIIILTNACKAKGIFSFPKEMMKGGGRTDFVFNDIVQGIFLHMMLQ